MTTQAAWTATPSGPATRFECGEEIKAAYELRDFPEVEKELEAWVDARAWTSGDGPKAMFNDTLGGLAKRHVPLPGVTTLPRLVARSIRVYSIAIHAFVPTAAA